MTKIEAIKEHIKLRETFWEIKYNPVKYAYGFVRCMLHSKDLIEASNAGLRRLIEDNGTARKLSKML